VGTARFGDVRFGDQRAAVTRATFDLYHLFSAHPGWDLEVDLDGPIGELWITGTGARPALPGPSPLHVAYLDRPGVVTLDGARGSIVPARSELSLEELGQGKVRITGTLHTTWTAVGDAAPRDYALELDLEAALVT
jgi:hypothetical protein